jgi:hypothetical protein
MKQHLPTLVLALCWLLGGATSFAQQGPPMPQEAPSPVELFRNLILTNAAARAQFLASKSADARRIIEAKLREFEGMVAEQREARLRALRLRWYTLQLMQLQPAERMARLESLPAADRGVVEGQLGPFIILPPGLQQEVLSNAAVMRELAGGIRSAAKPSESMTEEERKKEERKQQLLSHFPEFFQLRAADQSKAIDRLTATDRAHMEKTLVELRNLSKEERAEAIEGFKKFAELSPMEQSAFLKTADRWRSMSQKDRALWRKIVALLQSPPPPMPPRVNIGLPSDTSVLLGKAE